eukprot:748743-Hanusia_phi.AAC.2
MSFSFRIHENCLARESNNSTRRQNNYYSQKAAKVYLVEDLARNRSQKKIKTARPLRKDVVSSVCMLFVKKAHSNQKENQWNASVVALCRMRVTANAGGGRRKGGWANDKKQQE